METLDIDTQAMPEAAREAIEKAENRFAIDSDDKAEWYLRKLANLDAESKRIAANSAKMLADIAKEAENLRSRFESDLAAYVTQRIELAGGKKKTVEFMQGSCSFRTVPGGVAVADAVAALDYAQVQGLSVVTMTPKLDIIAYRDLAKEALKTTGELLPGCELRPEKQSFSVRFAPREGNDNGND